MSGPFLALYAVVRGVIFVTLLGLIGTLVANRLIRQALDDVPDLRAALRFQIERLPLRLAAILGVAVLLKGGLQVLSFRDPGEPVSLDLVQAVLLSGSWGTAWLVQLAAIVAAVMVLRLFAAPEGARALVVTLTAVIVWAQTGMGHAAGDRWPWVTGRLLDAGHVIGIGIWLGTLAILAFAAFPSLVGPERLPSLAALIARFSFFARLGAVLVIVSGTVAALVYGGPLAQVLQSTWGRLLAIKLACMLGVMGLGWYNWRRVSPGLEAAHPHSGERLRRAVGVELVLGIAMLALTTLLVVSALPGEG
jgi:putative copper export protein